MRLLAFLATAVAARVESWAGAKGHTNLAAYLSECEAFNLTRCSHAECLRRNHVVDPSQLDAVPCATDDDCMADDVGMVCAAGNGGRGVCRCRRGHAFDMNECACKEAEPCALAQERARSAAASGGLASLAASAGVECFNGMACADDACSCADLKLVLYEAHSKFCVAKR